MEWLANLTTELGLGFIIVGILILYVVWKELKD